MILAKNKTALLFSLVTLIVLLFSSSVFCTPPSTPKLDMEMGFDLPDEIILNEPFTVTFWFKVNEAVSHPSDLPDEAGISMTGHCKLLSGELNWEGILEKGTEVSITIELDFEVITYRSGIDIFITSIAGDFAEPNPLSGIPAKCYTYNRIRSPFVKILTDSTEIRDIFDTLTVKGRKLTEEEKDKWRNRRKNGEIHWRPLILSSATKDEKSNAFNLGELKVIRGRLERFVFRANKNAPVLKIEDWSVKCNEITFEQDEQRICKLQYNSIKDTCTLVIAIDSIEYSILLVVQETTDIQGTINYLDKDSFYNHSK